MKHLLILCAIASSLLLSACDEQNEYQLMDESELRELVGKEVTNCRQSSTTLAERDECLDQLKKTPLYQALVEKAPAPRSTTNFENPEPLDEYICALCQ